MEPSTTQPRKCFCSIFKAQFQKFKSEQNPLWRSLAYALLFAIDGIDVMSEAELAELDVLADLAFAEMEEQQA